MSIVNWLFLELTLSNIFSSTNLFLFKTIKFSFDFKIEENVSKNKKKKNRCIIKKLFFPSSIFFFNFIIFFVWMVRVFCSCLIWQVLFFPFVFEIVYLFTVFFSSLLCADGLIIITVPISFINMCFC